MRSFRLAAFGAKWRRGDIRARELLLSRPAHLSNRARRDFGAPPCRTNAVVRVNRYWSEGVPALVAPEPWSEGVPALVAPDNWSEGVEFLQLAPEVPVETEVTTFELGDASEALEALRDGEFDGSGVLTVS